MKNTQANVQVSVEDLEKEAIALVETAIANDNVQTEENFGYLFSQVLFNDNFDWRSELFEMKNALKQLLVLLASQKIQKVIAENELALDENASALLLRLFNFLDELDHEWKDKMELYTIIHQYNTPVRLQHIIKEYRTRIRMQEMEKIAG